MTDTNQNITNLGHSDMNQKLKVGDTVIYWTWYGGPYGPTKILKFTPKKIVLTASGSMGYGHYRANPGDVILATPEALALLEKITALENEWLRAKKELHALAKQ